MLTGLLVPALRRGAPSRVVIVTSGGMYTARLDVGDPQLGRRDYDGPRFYAHAKRAQVALAELWAAALARPRDRLLCDASGLGRQAGVGSVAAPVSPACETGAA